MLVKSDVVLKDTIVSPTFSYSKCLKVLDGVVSVFNLQDQHGGKVVGNMTCAYCIYGQKTVLELILFYFLFFLYVIHIKKKMCVSMKLLLKIMQHRSNQSCLP